MVVRVSFDGGIQSQRDARAGGRGARGDGVDRFQLFARFGVNPADARFDGELQLGIGFANAGEDDRIRIGAGFQAAV